MLDLHEDLDKTDQTVEIVNEVVLKVLKNALNQKYLVQILIYENKLINKVIHQLHTFLNNKKLLSLKEHLI